MNTKLTNRELEARRAYYRKNYEAHKEQRREYLRKWRKDHPDRVREYETKRWNKIAEQMEKEGNAAVPAR